MSSRKTTTLHSHSYSPSENKNVVDSNHNENNSQSLQGETSVEANKNPTDITWEIQLQIRESSYCEIITGQVYNPAVELQQSSKQTQAQKRRLRLEHQGELKLHINY